MKQEVCYEYRIDLQNYQTRENDPDIILYSSKCRDSFLTCLRKCKNKRLETERKIELKRGSRIYLYRPTDRVRGYMVLTNRGRIKDYGVYGKDLDMFATARILIRLLYACLNDASINTNYRVLFKVPVKLYILNRFLEEMWTDINCKIDIKIKNLWVPKEVKILNRSYKTWKRQVN